MGLAGRVLDPVARAHRVKPEALAPNNAWALTGKRLVREAIARERPDVVVATSPPTSALFATAGAIGPVPFVADLRDLWAGNPYYDRGSRLLASLQGRALARAAAVVTVSDGCRDRLWALHPELGDRVHVLTNGFDPALLARRLTAPPQPETRARILFAGSLYGDHTAEPLVEAVARPELRGRAQLEFVGVIDPRTRHALAEAGVDASVDPPISWSEAIERMLGAEIAVAITTPSAGGDMALPIKLFEALALGRPALVLARPNSDSARLLERLGQDAGLAPPDDPAAIAAAIERLLANPPPPVAPEALAEFDADRIAARYAELLDEVVSRSRSSSSLGTTASRR
jgi:glycosyltransferase involved in cell wall biosynthesis